MFPVQTNTIFLTPPKARKGGTLKEAVQVTRFRLPAGFARSGRCLRILKRKPYGAMVEAALAQYLLDRYGQDRRAPPQI